MTISVDATMLTMQIEVAGQLRTFYSRPGSSDAQVIRQVFAQEEYQLAHSRRRQELVEFLAAKRAAGLRPLIIDAGANIGAASIYFAHQFPDARIIAVEPEPGNFALLQRNLQGLDADCLPAALAGTRHRRRLVDAGEGHWGYSTELMEQGEIEAVTMDDLLAGQPSGFYPLLVKIDIEGGEADVFAGNTQWVDKTPLIIAELHDWMYPRSGVSRPFLRCMADRERDFIQSGENIISMAHDLSQL